MFENGSAQVEPYMRDVLRAIAPVLNDIPNKISISGHTDAVAYSNGERGYSNWELSADRANASRRELITGGLAEGKIMRVIGMSSTMSFDPKQPDAAINRRISLLVLNKKTELSIEQENETGQGLDINNSDELMHQPAFKSATDKTDAVPSADAAKVPANAGNPAATKPTNSTQTPVSSTDAARVPANAENPAKAKSANPHDVVAPPVNSSTKPTTTGSPVATPIVTPDTVPITTPTGTPNPAVSSSKQPGSQQR
jgi:chemotaxis protein MotB